MEHHEDSVLADQEGTAKVMASTQDGGHPGDSVPEDPQLDALTVPASTQDADHQGDSVPEGPRQGVAGAAGVAHTAHIAAWESTSRNGAAKDSCQHGSDESTQSAGHSEDSPQKADAGL